MQEQGYVSWVGSNSVRGTTLHSFRMQGVDKFFGTGEKPHGLTKGDKVSFSYFEKNGRNNVDVSSISKDSTPASVSQSSPVSSVVGGRTGAGRDEYWANKEARDIANEGHRRSNELRIQYQSARNASIELLKILVDKGLLIIPEKKGSGYDVVMAKLEDLTNEFFHKTSSVGTLEPAAEDFGSDAEIPS